jgi:hypothetical protein
VVRVLNFDPCIYSPLGLTGCPRVLVTVDLRTGLPMLVIGISPVTVIGVPPFRCGPVKIWRRYAVS